MDAFVPFAYVFSCIAICRTSEDPALFSLSTSKPDGSTGPIFRPRSHPHISSPTIIHVVPVAHELYPKYSLRQQSQFYAGLVYKNSLSLPPKKLKTWVTSIFIHLILRTWMYLRLVILFDLGVFCIYIPFTDLQVIPEHISSRNSLTNVASGK
jgi:hypothetical protein